MNPSPLEDQSQNCIGIFQTFITLLLPVLQNHVDLMMNIYLLAHYEGRSPISFIGSQTYIKIRKMMVIMHHEGRSLPPIDLIMQLHPCLKKKDQLTNRNALAQRHIPRISKEHFESIETCTDVRVLLTIIAKGEIFTAEEAHIAKKLKKAANDMAHTQIGKFTKEYTFDALETLERLLQVVPENTQEQMRDIQQLKKYGWQASLQNRSGQETTVLGKSLEYVSSNIPG